MREAVAPRVALNKRDLKVASVSKAVVGVYVRMDGWTGKRRHEAQRDDKMEQSGVAV